MAKHALAGAGKFILSIAAGFSISFALAVRFFEYNERAPIDRFFLFAIPALAVGVCAYSILPRLWKRLEPAAAPTRTTLAILVLLSAISAAWLGSGRITVIFFAEFAALSFVFGAIVIPAAPFVQRAFDEKTHARIFFGWVGSALIVFFIIGFLDDFYGSFLEVAALTTLLQFAFGIAGQFFVKRISRPLREHLADSVFMMLPFFLTFAFAGMIFQANRQSPLFPAENFTLNPNLFSAFFIPGLLTLPWLAWARFKLMSAGFYEYIKSARLYSFVNANWAGLALSASFFVVYLLTASILNHPDLDVDDIFFDADGLNWRLRLTTDTWRDFYWRSVHPFVLLLLKPPVDLVGFFLKGDKLFAAYIIVALGGALCVFLAWRIIKKTSGSALYASLIAAMLGFSTSHLIFGALIESYIFLAASLLLFYLFLVEEKPLSTLILAALPAIGITHSNFAQNVIAIFTVRPNLKTIFRFVASVLVLLVLLSLLNNLIYPDAHPFFFIPSALLAEEQNIFPLNALRIQALIRAFLFQNIVAPEPILYSGDIPFVQFRFFKPEIDTLSGYDFLLQDAAAWFWLALLIAAAVLFLVNFRKNQYNRISLALAGCMALNVALHLRYGKELFLYSPNWTYALILLLGLAWQPLSRYRWFQAVLLAFLIIMTLNNGALLTTIFDVLASQFD